MSWIKVLLIASALLVLVVLFRHRNRVLLRAGTRLAAVVLFLLAVVSIANPDIPQEVANRVGVVRGTDLLLYLLVVVFTLTTLGLFFRLRETDNRVHQLARSLAIQEALRREEQAPPGHVSAEHVSAEHVSAEHVSAEHETHGREAPGREPLDRAAPEREARELPEA